MKTRETDHYPDQNEAKRVDGYRGLYLERNGESAAALLEVLLAKPKHPLDLQDKEAAYQFEHDLAAIVLSNGETVEQFIEAARSESLFAPLVFPEYIVDGTVDVAHLDPPHVETADDVYQWLARAVSRGGLSTAEFRAIAKQTVDAYRQRMATALAAETDLSNAEETVWPLVIMPEEVIGRSVQARELRNNLLGSRRDLQKDDIPLEGAKRAILDVYLARINSTIAGLTPGAYQLALQAEAAGDEEMAHVAHDVISVSFRSAFENEEGRRRLMWRLDYLKNGLGVDENGHATAVTSALHKAARPETHATDALFSPEQTETLKNTYLEPAATRQLFEHILDRAGLLSAEDHSTWNEERHHRAADGLFQVIVNAGRISFSVDGISGAYKVPSERCSLYKVLAVGGAHELQHVLQSQSDQEVGKTLRIGRLKGKRPSMLREGGANAEQRKAELALFGVAKPIALTYGRALQVLEAGGGIMAATKAFYDEKRRVFPGIAPQEAAKEAADRVLRLIRYGGRNSQPLAYAEEGILIDELEGLGPEVQARAMAFSGLDLVDQVKLHKYGLLPSAPETIDWMEHVLAEVQPLIMDALSKDDRVGDNGFTLWN